MGEAAAGAFRASQSAMHRAAALLERSRSANCMEAGASIRNSSEFLGLSFDQRRGLIELLGDRVNRVQSLTEQGKETSGLIGGMLARRRRKEIHRLRYFLMEFQQFFIQRCLPLHGFEDDGSHVLEGNSAALGILPVNQA